MGDSTRLFAARRRLLMSRGSSRLANPRNLEGHHYATWTHELVNVIRDRLNLAVNPQLQMQPRAPVAFPGSPQPAGGRRNLGDNRGPQRMVEDGDDLDMFSHKAPKLLPGSINDIDESVLRLLKDDYDADDCGEAHDLSFESELSEVGTYYDKLPDFAILHLLACDLPVSKPHYDHPRGPGRREEEENHRRRYNLRGGVKTTHQCCVLLAEIKPAPERHSCSQQDHEKSVEDQLTEAQTQLFKYLGSGVYEIDTDYTPDGNALTKPVIIIAASGAYWRSATVSFDEFRIAQTIGDEKKKKDKSFQIYSELKWDKDFVLLGSPDSDARMERIRMELLQKELCDEERLQMRHPSYLANN